MNALSPATSPKESCSLLW